MLADGAARWLERQESQPLEEAACKLAQRPETGSWTDVASPTSKLKIGSRSKPAQLTAHHLRSLPTLPAPPSCRARVQLPESFWPVCANAINRTSFTTPAHNANW